MCIRDSLIGAEVSKGLADAAAHKHLADGANLDVSIRVEIIVDDVAIFEGDFEEKCIVAIDGVVSDVLDFGPLLLVIDERAIDCLLYTSRCV